MQRYFYLLFGLLLSVLASAQTIIFTENFENVDSVTTIGNPLWVQNSALQSSGAYSFHGTLATSDTSWVTTNAFNTSGYSFVLLEYNQICKIEFFDEGILEVSNDNGATWTRLTATEYLGQGNFGNQGNKFTSVSYADWLPGNNTAIPDNTWWKPEIFDISAIAANSAQVKVRFRLNDGNNTGSSGNYGWLIDDLKIIVSPSELIPPVIVMQPPLYQGTVYSTGPFNITAQITDASGIDTADVIYTVNGGALTTVGMTPTGGDIFVGQIPAVNDGDTVCYYVTATDSAPAQNMASLPSAGCTPFYVTSGE